MEGMTKLVNSAGRKADPSGWVTPVQGTGQTLTATTAATAYTATVMGGKRYLLASNAVGTMFFSFTGVITTAANIEHVLTKAGRIGIQIPEGVTTLHFGADTNLSIAYLVEVQSS
jgi:hypothetical protein